MSLSQQIRRDSRGRQALSPWRVGGSGPEPVGVWDQYRVDEPPDAAPCVDAAGPDAMSRDRVDTWNDGSRRNSTDMPRQSPRTATTKRSDSTAGGRWRGSKRLLMWRRRHLNVRTVVAVIALSALLAPGAAAIIEAAL